MSTAVVTSMPDASGPLESTSELIRRVREGDRDSLERLVERHLAPLRRYVSGRLPDGPGTLPTLTTSYRTR